MLKLVKKRHPILHLLRRRMVLIVLILIYWFSEIIDKLVKEGTLSKAGTDCYTIMKQKVDYFFALSCIFSACLIVGSWCDVFFPILTKPQCQNHDYEFDATKEEMDGQVVANGKNAQQDAGEDHMYMKVSVKNPRGIKVEVF